MRRGILRHRDDCHLDARYVFHRHPAKARNGRPIDLEVDGGINAETAAIAVRAGADVLVAGTATFAGGPPAYAGNIRRLRDAAVAPP